MDDLISRQAAIDALGEKPLVWDDLSDFDLGKAAQWSDDVDAIKALPSAQPEQAIKDCRNCKFGDYNDHWNTNFCYYSGDCNNCDKWEPSAQPQRMRGEWIDVTKAGGAELWKCSECGELELEDSYFCPNCGADMRGEEDAVD